MPSTGDVVAFSDVKNARSCRVYEVDKGYYADNEDAFHMRKYFIAGELYGCLSRNANLAALR